MNHLRWRLCAGLGANRATHLARLGEEAVKCVARLITAGTETNVIAMHTPRARTKHQGLLIYSHDILMKFSTSTCRTRELHATGYQRRPNAFDNLWTDSQAFSIVDILLSHVYNTLHLTSKSAPSHRTYLTKIRNRTDLSVIRTSSCVPLSTSYPCSCFGPSRPLPCHCHQVLVSQFSASPLCPPG